MFSFFANPDRFLQLSTYLRPVLFYSALVLFLAGVIAGLFFSPEDYQQGHSVRIMYVHVPAAWMTTIGFSFIAFMSAIAFIWRHSLADEAAKAAAHAGLVMTALALITGAIWGKPTWGAWWVWDARLTSVLVLLFIYMGYIAVWEAIADKTKAAKFARIIALIGFVNIPIVKFSVDWWNSLHQPASIIRAGGPSIDTAMLLPLFLMIGAYTAFFGWYVIAGVEASIYERRAFRTSMRAPSKPTTITEREEGND